MSVRHINKIDIDEILLKDLSGDTLTSIKRATVHISPLALLKEQLRINTVILENPRVNITKECPDSAANIQFLLDILAGNDTAPSTSLPHIRVGQLHIYDGSFGYNVKSIPEEKSFSPSHINIDDITANISLKKLSADTLSLYIRKLSGKECSGVHLQHLTAKINASKEAGILKDFSIELPDSRVEIPQVKINYTIDDSTKHITAFSYEGEIRSKLLTGADIAPLLSNCKNVPNIRFEIPFKGNDSKIGINKATLATISQGVNIETSFSLDNSDKEPKYKAQIALCQITDEGLKEIGALLPDSTITQEIQQRVGEISIKADITAQRLKADGTAQISTNSGNLTFNIKSDNNGYFEIESEGEDLNIGRITDNKDLGLCQIKSVTSGYFADSTNYAGEIKATINSLQYKEHNFAPINIDGAFNKDIYRISAGCNDKDLSATIDFAINKQNKNIPVYSINVNADTISPYNIGLTERLENSNISFEFAAELSGNLPDSSLIKANLYNFKLHTPQKYWKIRHLHLTDNSLDKQRNLIIDSDIISGYIMGYYTYNTLANSIMSIVDQHLPALELSKETTEKENNFVFDIKIANSEIISHLLDLPICIEGASNLSGNIDEQHNYAQLSADLYNTTLLDSKYKNINIDITSDNDRLSQKTKLVRHLKETDNNEPDNDITILLDSKIANDTLVNNFEWSNKTTPMNRGKLSVDVTLKKKANGNTAIAAHLHPGMIIYNDSIWRVAKSSIEGEGERFKIDNFSLRNNKRQLSINGVAGNSNNDSLKITLNQIDLEELFDIVNFHPVDFGGKASGTVDIARIFASPQFASKLEVENFKFEKGLMGWLNFDGRWEEKQKAILLDGLIYDGTVAHSTVKGFVSPANDTLNISIHTNGARIEFLNYMLSSFLDQVDGRAVGELHVRGRMRDVNLYGALCPTGSMRLKPTNTTYYLHGDTIHFTRNRISFNDINLTDRYNNKGILNGAVSHKSLKNFTCDFNIKADNLLAYDESHFGDNGFYGTAFVTGNAHFTANDNGIGLNAEIETNNNSKFVYNAAGPIGATDNKFITFTDRKAVNTPLLTVDTELTTRPANDILSRLRLDFMINATPGLQLRVYTNTITNDYIDLYGNGPINAVYDEKEGFSMKGNLSLTRGTYKFTMQDIFPKEFDIQPESTLSFNGDPFLANLNLKTVYTVPSAPLTDLSISAERRKTVKVNCLMDITGTLQNPNLSFGLELPDGNEEERELLAGATTTPEQTNMQFIYLIGIGKFYTYDYNSQASNSQSSTMMESLISSTISGQLNNMLSQITDNDNWNFSGNFTTSERGWNSMEVEGMLSGRLLDNRLLINGNFGYRDNPLANKNFIGDFEVQWLLNKSGNISLKAYNKTNDRYFSKTTLTTQGAGIMLRHDFNNWLLKRKKKEENKDNNENR